MPSSRQQKAARTSAARTSTARTSATYFGSADLGGARNIDLSAHKDPETPFVRKSEDNVSLTPEERTERRHKSRAERATRYREKHPNVPVVEHLDAKILYSLESNLFQLEMNSWHGTSACGTTHCRAGSAIHLAGDRGYALEQELGDPQSAGRAIYLASTGRVPQFFTTNDLALDDIKRCAAEDPLPDAQATP